MIINLNDAQTGEPGAYSKVTLYANGATMTDALCDGVIYLKLNNEYFRRNFTGAVNVDWFGADPTGTTDSATAFNSCSAAVIAMGGGTILAAGRYKMSSPWLVQNAKGLIITGSNSVYDGTAYVRKSLLMFDNMPSGTSCVEIDTFVGVTVKDIAIDVTSTHGPCVGLELHQGHDFTLSGVKVSNTTGKAVDTVKSAGIKLGRRTGEFCAFAGVISGCKVYNPYGNSFESNEYNTSLTFTNCYSQSGRFFIRGTVYSSFISCASDSSTDSNGYYLIGNDNSNCNSLTFLSCGAEKNKLSGFRIDGGCLNINIVNPHSGGNNYLLGTPGIGDLLHLESSNGGLIEGITLSGPVVSASEAGTTCNIFGAAGVGNLTITGYEERLMAKGIDGDADWKKNKLTIINRQSKFPEISLKSDFAPFTIGSDIQGGGYTLNYKINTVTLPAAKELELYPGSPTVDYIHGGSRIIGYSIRNDNAISSTDGGTKYSVFAVHGTQNDLPYPIMENLEFEVNEITTKYHIPVNPNNAFVDPANSPFSIKIKCDNEKTFAAGGQITFVIYYERLLPLAKLP